MADEDPQIPASVEERRALVEELNAALDGSPYSLPVDDTGAAKAAYLLARLRNVQSKVAELLQRVDQRKVGVSDLLTQTSSARLVYESNQLEGLGPETLDETRRIIEDNSQLDALTRYGLGQLISSEPNMREVVGLHEAYEFAASLIRDRDRGIQETDIRNLHALITAGEEFAGRYKQVENEISGSSHATTREIEVPRKMREFAVWLNRHEEPTPLVASVVHAWLTEMHPFEDGNGRLARLLANLCLYREGWPPLLIRGSSDRGEYLEALEHSDTAGDILPFFEVFAKALDRATFEMAQPNFALELLRLDLNLTEDAEFEAWLAFAQQFFDGLRTHLSRHELTIERVGSIRASDFELLRRKDHHGNGWFAKIKGGSTRTDVLVWFGFHSRWMKDYIAGFGERGSPSFFFSERDPSPDAIHPYKRFKEDLKRFPLSEVALDARRNKLLLRRGRDVYAYDTTAAIKILTRSVHQYRQLIDADEELP